MATIRFEAGTDAVYEQATEDMRVRRVFGDEQEMELFEIRYTPNAVQPPHAHVEAEIMYVLEGELTFGNRTYGPGTAVHVPAMTLYAYKVGPEGALVANFRPAWTAPGPDRYLTQEQFMERRVSANAPGEG